MLLSRLPLPSIKRALRVRSIFETVPSNELTPALKTPPRNPPSSLEGGALDLHVLGLPPAFALSQDQTLKLDEKFIPDWSSRLRKISRFDEVHPLINREIDQRCTFENVDRQKSLPDRSLVLNCFATRLRSARTPPSTFLFLPIHFSNSPGTKAIPLSGRPESRRS